MPEQIKSFVYCATALMFVVAGCTPEPEAPAPEGTVKAESVKPRAAEAAQPQAATPSDNQAAEGPQLVPPTNEPQEAIARTEVQEPQRRTAFYRADTVPAEIPTVILSKGHEALCKVKVGDSMPEIVLPQIGKDAKPTPLSDLFGEKATVVVFWKSDRRMAREQLADLGPDVVEPFGDDGAAIVGIAVEESPESAGAALQDVSADFPNLLDRDGKAFAAVGSEKLPRTYVLDPQGKILWFDIEYSLSTRRDLHQALRAIAGDAGDSQE